MSGMKELTRESWHGYTIGTDNRVNDTVCENIGGSVRRNENDG